MRTINEVVVDVLANPEAYTDAFPVSAPERAMMAFDPETATLTMGGINELANGASLTPEMVEVVRERMRRGVWSDGNTRFVQDESHPRDRVTMVNVPLREDSWAARMLNQERRLDQRYFGDGSGFLAWREADLLARPTVWEDLTREAAQQMINMTAIDDPSMGTAERADAVVDAEVRLAVQNQPRPDHYRVSPGRCHCGFTSMFSSDMARHLEGPVSLEWWTVCECGASALCHQVAEPAYLGLDFATHQPTMRTHRIYLCDACCQRRGIRG